MLNDSQTHRPSKCSAFNTARYIFSQAQLFQNSISKSVCLWGTTAGVIRERLLTYGHNFLRTKHHTDKISYGQNVLRTKRLTDKMSYRQNVLRTKRPTDKMSYGQNVTRTKCPTDQVNYNCLPCHANEKDHCTVFGSPAIVQIFCTSSILSYN